VWRAFDTATDRIVALKVLPAHLADDAMFQKRFRREARAAAGLYEPHVVPIHSYGEIDGRLYVDMRLIVGRDLQTVLGNGPLDPVRAVTIVEQVASALHAAHQIGLVHRDVKPSNVLVADADFAYLIDFGIARVAGETGLTSTGSTIGTWAYMAPERFGMGDADHRSDVYALACVLHQCLTGQRPFPGESVEQQVAGHLTTRPPRPSAITVGVPQAFDDVIAAGMAKNPGERYSTTRELAQAARAALTTATRRPSPHPPPVTAAAPIPRSAEPQPQASIIVSNSSATSDSGSGTSSVDVVAGDSNAEELPSRDAREVLRNPAADTRTRAGPTVSASVAPTQQAPISVSDDRNPAPRLAALARPAVQEPGSQRLNPRSMLLLGAVALLIVVGVAVVAHSVGSRSGGGVPSPTSTTRVQSSPASSSYASRSVTPSPSSVTPSPSPVAIAGWGPGDALANEFQGLLPATPEGIGYLGVKCYTSSESIFPGGVKIACGGGRNTMGSP
jgi:serine/threonine-protein kinase